MSTRVRCVAAFVFACGLAMPVRAQSVDASLTAEVTALRKSVDQLVELLKVFVQQSTQRDRTQAQVQRIDIEERRVTQLQQQIEALRTKKAAEEAEMNRMRASLQTYSQMALNDPTGQAQAAMEREKVQTNAEIQRRTGLTIQMDADMAQLEVELNEAKRNTTELKRQTDAWLGLPAR